MGKFINVMLRHTTISQRIPLASGNAYSEHLLKSYTYGCYPAYESARDAIKYRTEVVEEDFKHLPENAKNKEMHDGSGDSYIAYDIGEEHFCIRYEIIWDVYLVEKELA